MRLAAFYLLLCLVLSIFSCGQGPVEPGSDADVIMPLKIGNRWDGMAKTYFLGDSSTTATTLLLKDKLKIDKEIWFVGEYSEQSEVIGHTLYSNRKDGLWAWQTNPDKPEGTPYLLAKYPANKGDIYDGPYIESYYVVTSTDTAVHVDNKKYKCYSYIFETPSIIDVPVRQSFWAPGTGQVKYEIRGGFGMTQTIWQLEQFSR